MWQYISVIKCAKKVVSNNQGLVHFAFGLVNFVLHMLSGQVKFF